MNELKNIAAAWLVIIAGAAGAHASEITGNVRYGENRVHHTTDGTGEYLTVSLTIDVSDLTVPSGAAAVFTPCFIGSDTIMMQPVAVAGKRNMIMAERTGLYDGMKVVSRHNGSSQQIAYRQQLPWSSGLESGRIVILEDYCGCGLRVAAGNSREICEVDLAPLPALEEIYITPAAEAQKVRHLSGSAYLDFPVNVVEIIPDYRSNQSELQKIMATVDKVRNDSNTSVTSITIHGFASPEGPYKKNAMLAGKRADALGDYIKRMYSFPDAIFSISSTPENWEGLETMVAESNLPDKGALLEIIGSDMSPDEKEAQIRTRHPEAFRFMATGIFPALRRSDYTVTFSVRPFSVEEAREIIKKSPAQLSLREMFMVANSYASGSQEFNDVMELAATLYPDDATSSLNAAVSRLQRGDTAGAERLLAKAGTSPEAVYARGMAEYRKGNYAEALRLLEQSGIAPDSAISTVKRAIKRNNKY